MHAVLGIAELLMQKEDLPADVYDALAQINSSSGLLMATLDDILDLAKVEAGKLEINNASYETPRLIINTVQLNQVHKKDKELKFHIDIDENLPCRFMGDEVRIRQILNNLLSNAFKYTQTGSVTLSLNYSKNEIGKPYLCIKIKDTGQGLTAEQQENLFDSEFTRFNAQNNNQATGSGLGMSVVKQLLNLMNGDVVVESTPGVGSLFTVNIPQQSDGEETLGKELAASLQDPGTYRSLISQLAIFKQNKAADHSPMPYGRVLVVDDVESNIYVVQGILEHYEIKVDTARNGAEAVEKVKNGAEYDIIIMDHMMPVMDGIEATRQIREMGYTRPIVSLTANVVNKTEQDYIDKGFDGFLGKPINIANMETYLTRFIRNKYAESVFSDVAATKAKPVVLIVDDSPAALTMLNDILKPYYKILAARNGKAGLKIIEKQKVDLVLLDLTMPDLSGFDVLQQLNETSNTIPVIIISASGQPEDHVQGMALGAVDFLRKPFDKQTVLQRVKLHVRGTSVTLNGPALL
jgi:CheY-like chemotaxis protein